MLLLQHILYFHCCSHIHRFAFPCHLFFTQCWVFICVACFMISSTSLFTLTALHIAPPTPHICALLHPIPTLSTHPTLAPLLLVRTWCHSGNQVFNLSSQCNCDFHGITLGINRVHDHDQSPFAHYDYHQHDTRHYDHRYYDCHWLSHDYVQCCCFSRAACPGGMFPSGSCCTGFVDSLLEE